MTPEGDTSGDALPEPLTPADCDLRDFHFMPLDVTRLLTSETWLTGTGDQKAAAMTLWLVSWQQVPTASLPDNDRMLAILSQAGAAWSRARDHALRGWIKCADGRLYHPVVAEKANEAWRAKQVRRDRGRRGNEIRWGLKKDRESIPGASLCDPQAIVQGSSDNRKRQGQGEREGEVPPTPPTAAPRQTAPRNDPDFKAFYAAYPRHDAPDDAAKAWRQVTREGAKPADIMAGLARYRFNPDRQYIKLPASWLRAGCWKADAAADRKPPPQTQAEIIAENWNRF